MDPKTLCILSCAVLTVSAWSFPSYPAPRAALRVTRFAAPPRHFIVPIEAARDSEELPHQRPKRGHESYDHDSEHRGSGVTGPVHTFVKTDKNANYKWGVRHHVGDKYSS